MKGIKKMGCILFFFCLPTLVFPLIFSKHENSPVILIIDDFKLSEHGRKTMQVAKKWSLGGCEIKSFNTSRNLLSYIKALSKALEHVIKSPNKKFLVNISLGSDAPNKIEKEIIRLLDKMGTIVVAAVGNDGKDKLLYPSAYEEVIAVAASKGGCKADYSNYGNGVDLAVETRERKSVEIYEKWTPMHIEVTEITTIEEGTSVSAPKLTGILALLWCSNPDMPRNELLITMRKFCDPMQDTFYATGKLGAGLLSDFSIMVNTSQKVKFMFYLLIIEALVLTAIFFSSLRDIFPGICFFGILCCMIILLVAFTDFAWMLRWGYPPLAACFTASFGIYLFFTAPLGGKHIYISYDPAYIRNIEAMKSEISQIQENIARMTAQSEQQRVVNTNLTESEKTIFYDPKGIFIKTCKESETEKVKLFKLQKEFQKMEKENKAKKSKISDLASILRDMDAQVTVSNTTPKKSRPHCKIHFTEEECKISHRSLFSSERYSTKTMKISSGIFSPENVADIIKKTLDG